jgi:hypothetical protein
MTAQTEATAASVAASCLCLPALVSTMLCVYCSIHIFDPWKYVTGLGVPCKRKAPHTALDVWGPDDTKLFAWPGNGVWALTAG